MSRLNRRGALFAVVQTAALMMTPSIAAADGAVTLRAIGPHVGDNVIRYVARNAEAKRFEGIEFRDETKSTPRFIITQLCGSLTTTYYEEFLAANKLKTLSVDTPLGDKARNLNWPACLYVKNYPTGLKKVVEPNETAWGIANRFTGGDASQQAMQTLFKNSGAVNLGNLKPKQQLLIGYQSLPTRVVPKGGADIFMSSLAREIQRSGRVVDAVVRETRAPDGEVFVSVQPKQGAAICKALGAPVINASSIEANYAFSLQRAEAKNIEPRRAEVIIVDNGFFGADQRINPDHFLGSPFPSAFFKQDDKSIIAQAIELEDAIRPLNFEYSLVPDAVSGHGTHVAGLILGGPPFAKVRDRLMRGRPWVRITVINAGKGTNKIQRGVVPLFMDLFKIEGSPRIVNMSIGFTGLSDQAMRDRFINLFESTHWNLYVVSAGNGNDDVVTGSIYPAALGGDTTANVLTVAALDGDFHFAPFSNRSSRSVDIAAPGCQVPSWVSNHPSETLLSGTSQAAPLVTFAAALLRTLTPDLPLKSLKNRVIASGDLLPSSDQTKAAYRVRLNIQKALLVHDDFAAITGKNAGMYVGSVRFLKGLKCDNENAAHPVADMYAYKAQDHERWLFPGRNSGRIEPPCRVLGDLSGSLTFQASHRMRDGRFIPEHSEITVPLEELQELVFRLQ